MTTSDRSGAASSAAVLMPREGSVIHIAGPWDCWVSARTELVVADDLVLLHQIDLPAGAPPLAPGAQVKLEWLVPRGHATVSAAVEEGPTGPHDTFRLRLAGLPVVAQRRQFLRVEVQLPLVLVLPDGSELKAVALDLSETGSRCITADASGLPVGMVVATEIPVEDGTIPLEAAVVRTWSVPGTGAGVLLEFRGLRVGPQDRLRRHVFALDLKTIRGR